MLFLTLAEDLERALRRGRHRARAFDALVERRRVTVRELADELGLPPARVVGILVGSPPQFAHHRSLVGLGVARVVWSGWAMEVEVTPLGLHQASLRGR